MCASATDQSAPEEPPEERLQRTKDQVRRVTVDTSGSLTARALLDLWRGLLNVRLWGMLAWSDLRQQYRRSTFGPLWITLSLAVFIGALGFLYADLFNKPLEVFIPHLTLGVIVWRMLSGIIEQGCTSFIAGEGIIKQLYAPLSVHAYRVVARQVLIVAHHSIIFVVVAFAFRMTPTAQWLLAVPGFLLIVLTGVWVAILGGIVSTRFRDVPQMVSAITQVIFFLTPVIWIADLVPQRAIFLYYNPFYHYIELVRAPLLNRPVDLWHWQFAGAAAVAGWIVTLLAYRKFRSRIAYWL